MRPTIDETLLEVARVMSRRGTCSRLQVGAVLARDTRIVATGYNGAPAGVQHCTHGDDARCTVAIHAERNVIGYAARVGAATEGTTLYVTHSPCSDCASVLIAAGVVRVVYGDEYRGSEGVRRLRDAGVLVNAQHWTQRVREVGYWHPHFTTKCVHCGASSVGCLCTRRLNERAADDRARVWTGDWTQWWTG